MNLNNIIVFLLPLVCFIHKFIGNKKHIKDVNIIYEEHMHIALPVQMSTSAHGINSTYGIQVHMAPQVYMIKIPKIKEER